MESNKYLVKHPKMTINSNVLKHNINRVWDLIKDFTNTSIYEDHDNLSYDLIILKGKNSYEIGSIFKLKWKSQLELTYVVDNILNQDECKQIKWKCIDSKPFEIRFMLIYTLHVTSNDNNTLIMIENIFEGDYYVTEEYLKISDHDRNEVLSLINNYLNKSTIDLYQNESIIIKSKMMKIWNIISNWVEFKNLVPFISEKVIYLGNPLKIDTKLLLKWTSKNIDCHLKVIKIDNDEQKNEWTYVMECFDGIPKPPLQNLSFTLFQISEDSILLEFKHLFLEPIGYEILQNISLEKQKILLELRKKIESVNC